jgi:pimeloyl-ACP methyl ester carboxylesterase
MAVVSAPVDGGSLAVEVLAGTTEPVLAIHGISSQRRLWNWLRAESPSIQLIAPDLRGRGDSFGVTGPSSVQQHADDMVAVLDAVGLTAAHVCGMSMGGFIGIDLAHRYPDRVKSLILVDGGFPMATPPGLTRDLLPVIFADRLGRLEQTWASLDEYVAFFTANTAPLLDPDDALLRDYLEHDLRDGRVRLSGEALLGDAESIFFRDNPWESLATPIRFAHAEWSTGKDTSPAYPPDAVERYSPHTVETTFVPGVDHAASIMTRAGGRAAAGLINAALA